MSDRAPQPTAREAADHLAELARLNLGEFGPPPDANVAALRAESQRFWGALLGIAHNPQLQEVGGPEMVVDFALSTAQNILRDADAADQDPSIEPPERGATFFAAVVITSLERLGWPVP